MSLVNLNELIEIENFCGRKRQKKQQKNKFKKHRSDESKKIESEQEDNSSTDSEENTSFWTGICNFCCNDESLLEKYKQFAQLVEYAKKDEYFYSGRDLHCS